MTSPNRPSPCRRPWRPSHRPLRSCLALPLLLVVSLLLTSPAAAKDPKQPSVKDLIDEGVRKMKAKDYEGALISWEAALARKEHKDIVLNIAHCHFYLFKAGEQEHRDPAEAAYLRYLALFKKFYKGRTSSHQAVVQRNLARLRGPARLTLEGVPDGAMVFVDGVQRGRGPILVPLELKPGLRRLEVLGEDSRSWTGEVKVGQGEHKTLAVDIPVPRRRSPLWLGLGAGATALAAGFLGLGLGGNVKHDALFEEAGERTDEAEGWMQASIAGYVLAGTLAAGAAAAWVLYGLSGRPEGGDQAAASRISLGAAPLQGGFCLGGGLTF